MDALLERMEADKQFGFDIMHAAGIRTSSGCDGMNVYVMTFYSRGSQCGPVFGYLATEDELITLVWPYQIKEPRIYQSSLKKACPIIAKTKHTGAIGIKLLIDEHNGKAYGVKWITGKTTEYLEAIRGVMKLSGEEFLTMLKNAPVHELLMKQFNYKYCGTLINSIVYHNIMLMKLKFSGYEIPINSDTGRDQVLSALGVEVCAPARSHQPSPQAAVQASLLQTLSDQRHA